MRLTKFYLSFLLLFAVHYASNAQTNYPSLKLTEEYNHIRSETDKSKQYSFKASKGLEVDISELNHEEIRKRNDGKDADVLQMVCEGGTFIVKISSLDNLVIDKATAQPFRGSVKFSGFRAGDGVVLSVGTIKGGKMVTFWATTIKVT